MRHRPEIDGLRAIAVAAVVLHHAGAPLGGGYLGVDIFFVISGFLITAQLREAQAMGGFSLWRFYERRARRILPALVVVALATVPLGWMLALPDQLKLLGQSLVALGGFATNVLFWLKSGYFAPAAGEIPLLHTWSLAVEEQFYLLFPFLLMLCPGPRPLTFWLWTLGLLSLSAAVMVHPWDRDAVFYLLPFRAWELLAGAILALHLARGGPDLSPRVRDGAALLGLGLILAGVALIDPWLDYAPLWALVPVVGTVLVIACARPGRWAVRVLSAPPMVGIGVISYSLYLWHQPVFAFARMAQFLPPTPWQMAGLVLLTGVLAWITWVLVEQPFRNPERFRSGAIWRGAAGAGLGLVLIGMAGHLGSGFAEQRFEPRTVRILETAIPSPLRQRCHFPPHRAPLPKDACVYFADAPPSWAVLGDSHGVELAHALGQAIAGKGESLIHLTASACPPALTFDSDRPGCRAWIERAVAWLEARPKVHTVVLAWRHNYYLFGENAAQYPLLPDAPVHITAEGDSAARRARYWRSLEELVARLSAGGRRVLFLDPIPEIGRPIQKYALHAGNRPGPLVTVPDSYWQARNAYLMDKIATLPVERLSLVRSCDPFCPGTRDGKALLFDDDHMSLAGAHWLVRQSGLIPSSGK